MNEGKLIEYIASKCHEVKNLREFYEDCKSKVVNCGYDLETGSTFWIDGISNKVEQMNKYYNQYNQGYRDISQLCYMLGGDYLKLFKYILESEGGNDNRKSK